MTVRDFSQLYYMDKDIKRLEVKRNKKENELAELKNRSTGIPGMNISGMPRAASHGSRIEEIISQIDETEREILILNQRIRKKRIAYESVKQELEDIIDCCDDIRIALILKYRFIDLNSWLQIAIAIGGNNTEESVRKAAYRYLRKKYPDK